MKLTYLDYEKDDLQPQIMDLLIYMELQKFGWSQLPRFRYVVLTMFEAKVETISTLTQGPDQEMVLILSVQYISSKKMQPLGCLFYRNDTDVGKIAEALVKYIKDLVKCECFVMATLSNISENIMKVIDYLSIRSGHVRQDGYSEMVYTVANMEIVHLFDPISLIENIRDLFWCHDIHFQVTNREIVGKYSDIVDLFKDKATPEDFKNIFDKNDPWTSTYAVRTFSQTTFHALLDYTIRNDADNGGTPELVHLFDIAFDSLAGEENSARTNRGLITNTSPHFDNWHRIVKTIRTMYLTKNNTRFDITHRILSSKSKMDHLKVTRTIQSLIKSFKDYNNLYQLPPNFIIEDINITKEAAKFRSISNSDQIQKTEETLILPSFDDIEEDDPTFIDLKETIRQLIYNLDEMSDDDSEKIKIITIPEMCPTESQSDSSDDEEMLRHITSHNKLAYVPSIKNGEQINKSSEKTECDMETLIEAFSTSISDTVESMGIKHFDKTVTYSRNDFEVGNLNQKKINLGKDNKQHELTYLAQLENNDTKLNDLYGKSPLNSNLKSDNSNLKVDLIQQVGNGETNVSDHNGYRTEQLIEDGNKTNLKVAQSDNSIFCISPLTITLEEICNKKNSKQYPYGNNFNVNSNKFNLKDDVRGSTQEEWTIIDNNLRLKNVYDAENKNCNKIFDNLNNNNNTQNNVKVNLKNSVKSLPKSVTKLNSVESKPKDKVQSGEDIKNIVNMYNQSVDSKFSINMEQLDNNTISNLSDYVNLSNQLKERSVGELNEVGMGQLFSHFMTEVFLDGTTKIDDPKFGKTEGELDTKMEEIIVLPLENSSNNSVHNNNIKENNNNNIKNRTLSMDSDKKSLKEHIECQNETTDHRDKSSTDNEEIENNDKSAAQNADINTKTIQADTQNTENKEVPNSKKKRKNRKKKKQPKNNSDTTSTPIEIKKKDETCLISSGTHLGSLKSKQKVNKSNKNGLPTILEKSSEHRKPLIQQDSLAAIHTMTVNPSVSSTRWVQCLQNIVNLLRQYDTSLVSVYIAAGYLKQSGLVEKYSSVEMDDTNVFHIVSSSTTAIISRIISDSSSTNTMQEKSLEYLATINKYLDIAQRKVQNSKSEKMEVDVVSSDDSFDKSENNSLGELDEKFVPFSIIAWAVACNGMRRLSENMKKKRVYFMSNACLNLNGTRHCVAVIQQYYKLIDDIPDSHVESEFLFPTAITGAFLGGGCVILN